MPAPLPVLPLRDTVLVPHVATPVLVGRPASLAAVEAAAQGDRRLLLVAQRDPEVQEPAAAELADEDGGGMWDVQGADEGEGEEEEVQEDKAGWGGWLEEDDIEEA